MSTPFDLFGRPLVPGERPLFIAELSGNHGGSLDQAIKLLDACAHAGADAVKIQSYEPDRITLKSDAPAFRVGTEQWRGRTLYDLYAEAQTPFEWHAPLFERARQLGVSLFSAPFDLGAVALLEEMDCPAYKIASCELVDMGLIAAAARTGKPLILSTGMAEIDEIEEALSVARSAGASELVLLHCISGYPTPEAGANLDRMADMMGRFDVPVGLSDHSIGFTVPLAAAARGAVMVEKHVRLDSDETSVDASFSLPVSEIPRLMADLDAFASTAGAVTYGPSPNEADSYRFRRSLFVARPVAAGQCLTAEDVRSVRPAGGLHTRHLEKVIGRTAAHSLTPGSPLSWDDLSDAD